jgi:hypothetical protein
MKYVFENLVQYDMTDEEALKLQAIGFLCPDEESEDKDELTTTAFVWDDLGLEGEVVFVLFDAVLGKRKVAA